MIEHFKEVRRDGKVIEDSMTLEEMHKRGWHPEKIVEIQWTHEGRLVRRASAGGILAEIVYGREFVAVIEHNDKKPQSSILSIIHADGSVAHVVSNTQLILGKYEKGEFRWFEPPKMNRTNICGVVFECVNNHAMYQLELDAAEGTVIDAYYTR